MRYTHIKKSDLNLLASFQALMEERSVTRAARRMFLSQPAMSRTFDRLRAMFDDELLVRTKAGYQPTQRAFGIYKELEQILPRVENLLRGQEFIPAETKDLFRIAVTGYASVWLVPKLLESLGQAAPNARTEISSADDGFRRLETNAIDLLLSSNEAPSYLRAQPIIHEPLVCLVRMRHAIGKQRLSLQRYLSLKHLALSTGEGIQPLVDRILDVYGYRRDVRVLLPYPFPVGAIVERTDLIATLPMRVARQQVELSMTRTVSAPFELKPFSYYQTWHPRNDSDPAHQWLRSVVRTIAA